MFESVGKRVPKYDGIGHVTGKTLYVSDLKMPGTLTAKTLRCPYHRARIRSIDTSEALKVKGVSAVITKDDLSYNLFSMGGDHHVLAEEITRYKGQNIAAAAAVDKPTALLALSKIKLDIEELPFVIDAEEAIKEDAVQIRPEGNNHVFENGTFIRKIRRGDVEAGFKQADFIVEGRYTTPGQEHAQLETCATLAYVDGNGVSIPLVGELPLGCAAVCSQSVWVQRLAVEAGIKGDIMLLRQAMMMDPLTGAVCTPPEIDQMVDEMLVACEKWLPQYAEVIKAAKVRLAGPLLPTRKTKGAARLHTKTVDEMRQNKDDAKKNAAETDKARNN